MALMISTGLVNNRVRRYGHGRQSFLSHSLNLPSTSCAIEDNCSSAFISDIEAWQLELDGNIRPMADNATAQAIASELLKHYGIFYPDVFFRLDWTDPTVNSFAGFFPSSGQRFVSLKGGLVRQATLDREGIAIIIAHELGHHYGGVPQAQTGLSCEGQADYYAVTTVLKNAWNQTEYTNIINKGIPQIAAFLQVSNLPVSQPTPAGCGHPAGFCRIATFYAAAAGQQKPACAC